MYTAYLFYYIFASIAFLVYIIVVTCYQQRTVRNLDSDPLVVDNDKVCSIGSTT